MKRRDGLSSITETIKYERWLERERLAEQERKAQQPQPSPPVDQTTAPEPSSSKARGHSPLCAKNFSALALCDCGFYPKDKR